MLSVPIDTLNVLTPQSEPTIMSSVNLVINSPSDKFITAVLDELLIVVLKCPFVGTQLFIIVTLPTFIVPKLLIIVDMLFSNVPSVVIVPSPFIVNVPLFLIAFVVFVIVFPFVFNVMFLPASITIADSSTLSFITTISPVSPVIAEYAVARVG